MSTKMPPVPPANRSDKGPGSDPETSKGAPARGKQPADNIEEAGERANIRQNTTNQGQQGR